MVRALKRGVPKPDIAAGICEATADRVVTLLKRVGVEPELGMSGGIGKNVGAVERIGPGWGCRPGFRRSRS